MFSSLDWAFYNLTVHVFPGCFRDGDRAITLHPVILLSLGFGYTPTEKRKPDAFRLFSVLREPGFCKCGFRMMV